ncbi:unnamed protein product, partial [Dovyalis caffra]
TPQFHKIKNSAKTIVCFKKVDQLLINENIQEITIYKHCTVSSYIISNTQQSI